MNQPHRVPEGRDGLANLAIAALVALAGAGVVLRAAGSLTALVTGQPQPAGRLASGLQVLAHLEDPGVVLGTPGLNPVAYWVCVTVLIAGLATGSGWVWSRWREHTRHMRADPRRVVGTATKPEIVKTASAQALARRARVLRPSLAHAVPADVGYLIGYAHGQQVWASVEDSILVLGPPRSGKGWNLVINTILDAPGAVITTSTRTDNLTATLKARQRLGPTAVFDPQHLAEGVPAGLRWSPVRGCEQPLTAMIRATGLASATGIGGQGVENGSFWEGKTRTALQALLHAAALDHRDSATLFAWTLDPLAATDALTILRTHPRAAHGWAQALDAMIHADPRTRDSIWQGVSLALAALGDPRVLEAVSPGPGEHFDPAHFLTSRGTVFLLATGAGAGAGASLVAAFIEDLIETARHLAAASPGARLDPPLLLALDEIGNLAPLPSLPTLMAEGGGTGITVMPVLQSLAQARNKWGHNAAAAIWDAAIVKVILGGNAETADLRDMSTLIGERDETITSDTRTETGGLSTSRSIRRVAIMPPENIRTLPTGTAITLLRTARPIVTGLRPWHKRPDAPQLATDRADIETILQETQQRQQAHPPGT